MVRASFIVQVTVALYLMQDFVCISQSKYNTPSVLKYNSFYIKHIFINYPMNIVYMYVCIYYYLFKCVEKRLERIIF
jgi:hypothetical protein